MHGIFIVFSKAIFRVTYDGKRQAHCEELSAETRISHWRCGIAHTHRVLVGLERDAARCDQQ